MAKYPLNEHLDLQVNVTTSSTPSTTTSPSVARGSGRGSEALFTVNYKFEGGAMPMLLRSESSRCRQVRDCRARSTRAEWVDGRATAGHHRERVKSNLQVAEGDPVARELGDIILAALERNPLFLAAALPLKVYPPLFNRYPGRRAYGDHIDGAIREVMRYALSRAHRSLGDALPHAARGI